MYKYKIPDIEFDGNNKYVGGMLAWQICMSIHSSSYRPALPWQNAS